jgi:two-component system LytT family response regulator
MKSINMVPISDYVALKMEVDRLTGLVEDLTEKLSKSNLNPNTHLEKGVFVNSNGQSKFIKISEILMVKAESNYSSIYTIDGQCHFTSKTLKYWEENCKAPFLVRTHKTYLINFGKIVHYERSTGKIMLAGNVAAHCSKAGKKILSLLR